jgi:hypothetical protein
MEPTSIQHSTGPRSVEGKAVTRFNALKHGIDAHSLVIPGEDPSQLQTLADDYFTHFQPAGPVENFLLTTVVHSDWYKRRLTRVQSILLRQILPANATGDEADFALAETFLDSTPETRALGRVARRLAAEHRNYMRALTELQRIQKQRKAEEAQSVPQPADSKPVGQVGNLRRVGNPPADLSNLSGVKSTLSEITTTPSEKVTTNPA